MAEESTTQISGLYERLVELLRTGKMIIASGEVYSSDTGTSKFAIPISISSISTGITISFSISNTLYGFIADKNTVAKLGG